MVQEAYRILSAESPKNAFYKQIGALSKAVPEFAEYWYDIIRASKLQ